MVANLATKITIEIYSDTKMYIQRPVGDISIRTAADSFLPRFSEEHNWFCLLMVKNNDNDNSNSYHINNKKFDVGYMIMACLTFKNDLEGVIRVYNGL